MKGITRLQASVKARALNAKFRRMREDKQRAEQERQQRLKRERQQKEHEEKLKKAQEEAAAQIQEMFSFIAKEEESYTKKEEKIEKSKSANAARKPHETQQKSSSLGASLVDGVRIFEELNRPAVSSYNPSWYNRLGHVTQSGSSDLAITLTALILGLACQGSTNDDQEVSSRDEPEKREPEFVSPLRTKPKGPQGSFKWRSGQS